MAAFAARFFNEHDAGNLDGFIQGFAHVVNREGGGSYSDQRFHLHAGLRGRGYGRLQFNAILA